MSSAGGQKNLLGNDQMDDANNAALDWIRDELPMIIAIQTGLLVGMILVIVLCSASLAISKRLETMSETLLRQSGDMQSILAQRLHETRSQAGSCLNGNGN